MSNKSKIISAVVAVIILILLFVRLPGKQQSIVGSVNRANEYFGTTTHAMLGGNGASIPPVAASAVTNRVIGTGSNVLGSVVVASSSATSVAFWNATSTTDSASTTLASFVASPANGTYTFDIIAVRGLIITMPAGFNGSYNITYR